MKEGDNDEEKAIFLINYGNVSVNYGNKTDNSQRLACLGSGQFFGEISFILNRPREISMTSISFTSIYKISRNDFLRVISEQKYDYVMKRNITF